MDDRFLGIYLNDHLAGATAGLELARRLTAQNRGTEISQRLEEIVAEVEEDRASLRSVMERIGAPANPAKTAAAWLAEKAGRAKLNGKLLGYSPLSRLEELEGLRLGVEGKRCLWITLKETRGADPRLEGIDLDDLVARAARQASDLEAMRIRSAAETFGSALKTS